MIKFTTAVSAVLVGIIFMESNLDAHASEALETLPDTQKNAEQRMPQGAITTLRSAGLLIASFDKNADFIVDVEEYTDGRDMNFSRADQNSDGAISLIELQDWRGLALGSLDAAPSNMAFDRNFDQKVDRTEFDEMFGYIFESTDANADRALAFSELIRVIELPDRSARGSGDRAERGKRGKGGERRGKRPGVSP